MLVTLRARPVQNKPYVGIWIKKPIPNLRQTVHQALSANFEFIGVNLLPHFQQIENFPSTGIFPWSIYDLSFYDWRTLIVGVLQNPEVELCQESNIQLRQKAENYLSQQLDYCTHLNLSTCILGFKDYNTCENSINIIYSKMLKGVDLAVWIDLPMFGKVTRNTRSDEYEQFVESNNPWIFWKKLHSYTLTDQQCNMSLALRLPDELQYESLHLQRWLTEPVKCIIINIAQFTQEPSKQIASLSGAQEDVVRRFIENGAKVFLESDDFSTPKTYALCLRVIENIKKQIAKELNDASELPIRTYWGRGYENILLDPLQPLIHDLVTEIYESFEKDRAKYVLYEEAIYKAILELETRRSERNQSCSEKMIILIAGAGRGPIVESTLRAARKANVLDFIDLIALDKNEMAVRALSYLARRSWNGKVQVVRADMRMWNPPMGKVDLIVSELLGSFGDNELSPECLDGAQKYLKPDGIIIPQSYSSFIQPIMSTEVFRTVRNLNGAMENALFERTYVVNFQNSVRFAPVQRLFTFKHPAELNDKHTNFRHSTLTFPVTKEGILHGFAGYFEATLFEDVKLSITPAEHTVDLISWWPLFLPIRSQIPLKVGDLLVAHFYRKVDVSRVWYEWTTSAPIPLAYHNPNGRHHSMGY